MGSSPEPGKQFSTRLEVRLRASESSDEYSASCRQHMRFISSCCLRPLHGRPQYAEHYAEHYEPRTMSVSQTKAGSAVAANERNFLSGLQSSKITNKTYTIP